MSSKLYKRRAWQEGFTLIELLVVVLVIGILASIAIPAFLGQRRKAQDNAAQSIIRSGVIAAESYYAENETFVSLVPALLAAEEQNVDWVAGSPADPNAQAKNNQVGVVVVGDGYALSSQSVTGTVFVYLRDANGAAFRCSGTGVPDPSTANLSLGCLAPYGSGW